MHGSCFDAGEIMGLPATLEQLIGTERLAFFRQVALVPCDLGPLVPEMSPGDDVVVLVHGFMASAGVFRPLRARSSERRACAWQPSPTPPGPAFGGLRGSSRGSSTLCREEAG